MLSFSHVPLTLCLENVEGIDLSASQVLQLHLFPVKEAQRPLYRMYLSFRETDPYLAAMRLDRWPDIVWVQVKSQEYELLWDGIYDDAINTLQQLQRTPDKQRFIVTVGWKGRRFPTASSLG